jgi:ssDNA-binding Zn-finger/Zn-ribbon topoisomerase 1
MIRLVDKTIMIDGFCPKCGSPLKGKMMPDGRIYVYCSNIFCNFSDTLDINLVSEEADCKQDKD